MDMRENRARDDTYIGIDVREVPLYGPTEAAKNLDLHVSTLRAWLLGKKYPTIEGKARCEPLIIPAGLHPPTLSFNNLVELHVLRTLRRHHSVPLARVREAIDAAAQELDIQRPLLSDLSAAFGEIFLQRFDQLVHLRRSEQLVLQDYFQEQARRVEHDEAGFPRRFYPPVPTLPSPERYILIDPLIRFGRPNVRGVPTSVIAERIDAGEEVDALTADYGIPHHEVLAALRFERPPVAT